MPSYTFALRMIPTLPVLLLSACGGSDTPEGKTTVLDTTTLTISSAALMGHSSGLPPATDSLRKEGDSGVVLGGLSWTLPAGWSVAPPSGPMRVGELVLPGGGNFAIFRFAKGGGTVASNLDRWRDQFSRRDTIWTETSSVPGFPVHLMVVAGDFEDGMGPHGVRDSAKTKQGQVLLGAILESPEGLVVFKAVLPEALGRASLPEFRKLLGSVRARG